MGPAGPPKRWALRYRSEPAVRQLADELSWTVAASLDRIIPTAALAITIRHAVLDELAFDQQLQRDLGRSAGSAEADPDDITAYTLGSQVTELLDWFLRHHPARMSGLLGEIVGEAQRRLDIPHKVTRFSLWMALMDNSKLEPDTRREVLDRLLPPPDPDPDRDARNHGRPGSDRTTAQGA